MAKHPDPSEIIWARLEEMFRLGASLQTYIHDLRVDAPLNDEKTKYVLEELHRLELRMAIVNDLLYQDKMDVRLKNAIERARNYAYKIKPKNLTD